MEFHPTTVDDGSSFRRLLANQAKRLKQEGDASVDEALGILGEEFDPEKFSMDSFRKAFGLVINAESKLIELGGLGSLVEALSPTEDGTLPED